MTRESAETRLREALARARALLNRQLALASASCDGLRLLLRLDPTASADEVLAAEALIAEVEEPGANLVRRWAALSAKIEAEACTSEAGKTSPPVAPLSRN